MPPPNILRLKLTNIDGHPWPAEEATPAVYLRHSLPP